jgi:PRTRC genetic system protein E
LLNALLPITEHATVTLVVARGAADGTLVVTVMPKPIATAKAGVAGTDALVQPFQLVGTPADIASAFAEQLASFTAAYAGLVSTVKDATATIAAAEQKSKDDAAKRAEAAKNKKPTTPVKATVTKPTERKATANLTTVKPSPVPLSQVSMFDSTAEPVPVADAAEDESALVGAGAAGAGSSDEDSE